MSHFPARWLRMREPFDHAARDTGLVEALIAALPDGHLLRVAELGAGLGSGMRYLAPRLGGTQRWTLVDHDPALLAEAASAVRPPGVEVETLERDLRQSGSLDLDVDLVSTQALLDLVSESWVLALADWLVAARLPLLAALTVDGRVHWSPEDPLDEGVMRCFRAHQETDRGFGPSPGPRAATMLAFVLSQRGHRVTLARADWHIGPDSPEMLVEMLEGIVAAATEAADGEVTPADIAQWGVRRTAAIAEGEVSLMVGHLDLLALPPG